MVFEFLLLLFSENLDTKELAAKFTTEVVAKSIFGIDGNSFTNENAEFRSMGTNIISNDILTNIKMTVIELFPLLANILKMR